MLIESVIKRDGVTEIVYDGFKYRFVANDLGHLVCDVNSSDHAKRFLRFPRSFREYKPGKYLESPPSPPQGPGGSSSTFLVPPPSLDDQWPDNEAVITESGEISENVKEKLDKAKQEKEIYELKESGKSFREIGEFLGLSARTAHCIYRGEKIRREKK
jgi:hypothetical protein